MLPIIFSFRQAGDLRQVPIDFGLQLKNLFHILRERFLSERPIASLRSFENPFAHLLILLIDLTLQGVVLHL